MPHDEDQIRTLIQRWARAVHDGDMDGVLVDHADDIVMFDVPPPQDGVRGLDAYRETWPPFFEWQAQGAVFDIESLEVVASGDVAFAFALIRCGTEQDFAIQPGHRLRLTLGLRKQGGRWVVAHEHHSFPDTSGDQAARAEQQVRATHDRWFDRTAEKDLDGLMEHIADDIVSYEHDAPLEYSGREAVREVCKRGLESAPGKIEWAVPALTVLPGDDVTVAWGLNRMRAEQADGQTIESWSRGTRVFRRNGTEWVMIHQHVSYPYDPESGEAITDLRP